MSVTKTIFKKDTKGKTRFLTVRTQGRTIEQISGIIGTPNPVINISNCVGKNLGKSNETTSEEQAVLEANAIIKDKLSRDYFETQEEAELKGSEVLLPMLAHDYKKHFKKVTYPCSVQPKLDGMRALGIANEDTMMSRAGKEITTLKHIEIKPFGDMILDGEVYAHGLSFQENMKLIKKYKAGKTELVRYHVYDMVDDKLSFEQRYEILSNNVKTLAAHGVELVPTRQVDSEAEMIEVHKEFISLGYEGTIIRHGNTAYEINKRSHSLLKYKDWIDEAYEIVDVIPSEARPEHGMFVCEIYAQGRINHFRTGMKFSHSEREKVLQNSSDYIGKKAEVRFFEFTDDGLPRFPVCHGIRLDK